AGRRPPQARGVLRQLGRIRGANPQRLEDAVAELEPAVEHRELRLVGRDHAPVEPDMARPARSVGRGSGAHATSVPPMAPSGPRALLTVSSHSSTGSLFHVIPPPTCRVNRRPSAT